MMISHLLTNANKFTDSGEIKISYKADTEKQKMEIRVMDSGCGISADKREWIFDRFTKSDDFSQGSGLGLYLCRLIANNMQAQIYLDVNQTQGSCFVVELPLAWFLPT